MFKSSERLTAEALGRDFSAEGYRPDASVMHEHDRDVGNLEWVEVGFGLAVKANGRDVWAVPDAEGDDPFSTNFFIGTEEEVLARILATPVDPDAEGGD